MRTHLGFLPNATRIKEGQPLSMPWSRASHLGGGQRSSTVATFHSFIICSFQVAACAKQQLPDLVVLLGHVRPKNDHAGQLFLVHQKKHQDSLLPGHRKLPQESAAYDLPKCFATELYVSASATLPLYPTLVSRTLTCSLSQPGCCRTDLHHRGNWQGLKNVSVPEVLH